MNEVQKYISIISLADTAIVEIWQHNAKKMLWRKMLKERIKRFSLFVFFI